MEGYNAEEGGVEYDCCAGFLVSEKLVFGLVVLEVLESFATADDTFFHGLTLGGGVCEAKWGEFIGGGVEGLNAEEISDIPNFDHAWGIRCHYLRGVWQALNSYQGMIMTSQQENFIFDVGIPDKSFMIQPSRKKTLVHLWPIAPSQRIYSFVVTSQLLLQLMGGAIPETDLASQAGSDQSLLAIDGQDIADGAGMSFLLRVSFVEGVPSRNGASFLEKSGVINVDDGIGSTRV